MKSIKTKSFGHILKLGLTVLIIFAVVSSLPAKEKSMGADLIIKKKDGQVIKAELLAVKGRDLIMMDHLALSELIVGIDEVRSIQIVKKSKVLRGMGIGLLAGAGSGALWGFGHGGDTEGFFRFKTGDRVLLGAIGFGFWGAAIGGGFGALAGQDEHIKIEGTPQQEIEAILIKLDQKARSPQRR